MGEDFGVTAVLKKWQYWGLKTHALSPDAPFIFRHMTNANFKQMKHKEKRRKGGIATAAFVHSTFDAM